MTIRRHLKKIYPFLILIFCILLAKNSYAECIWINKTNGLGGYKFTSLAIDKKDSNVVYVGVKGFLFRTSDGGENWESIFKVPGTNKAINFIAISPHDSNVIYIATEWRVFKSADGGKNWQPAAFGVGKDNVRALLIDSENENTVLAGTKKDIFITRDGGKNWIQYSQGLSAINIDSLAQNCANHKILFASAENGLFRSEDSGENWKKIFYVDCAAEEESDQSEYSEGSEENTLPHTPTWVSADPVNDGTIYLSTKIGISKSEDNGNSWIKLSETGLSSSPVRNLVIPSYNKGFIFAATEKRVFSFSEKEKMWKELYIGFTSKDIAFTALNGREDTLWLVAKNGVYKSKGDIYEIEEMSSPDKVKAIMQNFSYEPTYREIQEVAIKYAEVHPEKIIKWRQAAKVNALFPRLSFGIDKDYDGNLHWDTAGVDTWLIGPDDESTGWDITCTWDLGDLIWNPSQTSIDVRSKLMVQLRDDILDEITRLYFERRRLQVELVQNPPKNINEFLKKELRLQELTANIDAMTGGYLSEEIARRKQI